MLTLSRKPGEAIWIGPYRVVLGRVTPTKCEVALDVPRDVPVRRGEVAETTQQRMQKRRPARAG